MTPCGQIAAWKAPLDDGRELHLCDMCKAVLVKRASRGDVVAGFKVIALRISREGMLCGGADD